MRMSSRRYIKVRSPAFACGTLSRIGSAAPILKYMFFVKPEHVVVVHRPMKVGVMLDDGSDDQTLMRIVLSPQRRHFKPWISSANLERLTRKLLLLNSGLWLEAR